MVGVCHGSCAGLGRRRQGHGRLHRVPLPGTLVRPWLDRSRVCAILLLRPAPGQGCRRHPFCRLPLQPAAAAGAGRAAEQHQGRRRVPRCNCHCPAWRRELWAPACDLLRFGAAHCCIRPKGCTGPTSCCSPRGTRTWLVARCPALRPGRQSGSGRGRGCRGVALREVKYVWRGGLALEPQLRHVRRRAARPVPWRLVGPRCLLLWGHATHLDGPRQHRVKLALASGLLLGLLLRLQRHRSCGRRCRSFVRRCSHWWRAARLGAALHGLLLLRVAFAPTQR